MSASFVETICLWHGEPQHLALHQARLERTWQHFGFPTACTPQLALLLEHLPLISHAERCKWRVVYGAEGVLSSEVSPYVPRVVHQLQAVENADIDYRYKSTNRSQLEACYAQRGGADEVLILRHGWLTDTSIANVALFDGTQWYTPDTPLLAGVQRQYLLAQGVLCERPIHHSHCVEYTHLALFNAMLPWGEIVLPISALRLDGL